MPSLPISPLAIPTSPTSSFEIISPTLSQTSESFHSLSGLSADDFEEDEVVWLATSDSQSSVSFSDAEQSDDDFVLFPTSTALSPEESIDRLTAQITGLDIGRATPATEERASEPSSAVAGRHEAEASHVESTPTIATLPIPATPLAAPHRELTPVPRSPFAEPPTPLAPRIPLVIESEFEDAQDTPVGSRSASRTSCGVPSSNAGTPPVGAPKKKKRTKKSKKKSKANANANANAKAATASDKEYQEAKSYMNS